MAAAGGEARKAPESRLPFPKLTRVRLSCALDSEGMKRKREEEEEEGSGRATKD